MVTRQKLSLVEEELDEDPIGQDVPEERGPCPPPPDILEWEAKEVWLESAPDLWKKDRLHGGTISLLTSYCTVVGKARKFEAMMEVDGEIVKGKPHPAYHMMMSAISTSTRIAVELRFAREHVNSESRAEDNGWDRGLLA